LEKKAGAGSPGEGDEAQVPHTGATIGGKAQVRCRSFILWPAIPFVVTWASSILSHSVVSEMGLCLAVGRSMLFPVAADPQHYKLELENEKVRVLRIKYSPTEKSVMHGNARMVALVTCLWRHYFSR
jgi:hypothetical protein